MTLTRPAYTITVENLDNGWSQSVTAGETPDPEAGLWLADGLIMQWRFNEQPPSQLEPEVVEFALLAQGIENLPPFIEGDRVTVSLQRPTLTTPITYMDFAGRITDAKLKTVAKTDRVLLALTAVDPLSELTHDVTHEPAFFDSPIGMWKDAIFAYWGTYWLELISGISRWNDSPVVGHKGSTPAIELIDQVLPATIASPSDEGSYAVQRYLVDDITAPGWSKFVPPSGTPSDWMYYLAQWRPQPSAGVMPTLFEYAFSGTDPDKVTAVATGVVPDPDGAVTVLDAAYMPDGAEWTKDRSLAPNRIIINGVYAATAEKAPSRTVLDWASVRRFGAITRTVDTAVDVDGMPAVAREYLEVMATGAADKWMLRDTTLLTHLMDDDTLDAYAPLFWTPREPTPGVMGTPMLVLNVDPEVDPTAGFMFAHLAGVKFVVEDGKLAITPELVPAPAPGITGLTTGAPSFDEFGASAFGNATYHDQGGSTDYIDPELTYEQAKLTAL